jgi:DNA-binding LacI/PurR family transcriptional regulator
MAGRAGSGRRVTINDIAEQAGVSKGAVSYALNGRPGLSDETRARILEIADDLGWRPSSAARSLSASRADAVGLVLARPPRTLAVETFFAEFMAGVESELAPHSIALTVQLAADVESEAAVYRRWWAERRVDGVLVVDLRVDDPRFHALEQLGMPAVLAGGPTDTGSLPSVWHDERSGTVELVRYLAALGHTRIARVAGEPSFVHSVQRTAAFEEATSALELSATVVTTDYTPESGSRATRQLLLGAEPPTAIAFDSDVLAVTGLGVAQQMGFSVPDDISIIAWDDSLLCQVVHPPLTTMARDVTDFGALACKRLLAMIDNPDTTQSVEAPRAELFPRGSTGPAPAVRRGRPARTA